MSELNRTSRLDLARQFSTLGECPGQVLCAECFWWIQNGGCCPGCDSDYQERCIKQVCNLNCGTCGGGKHAHTPGCCGRTAILRYPRYSQFREILERDIPHYSPPPISIHCPLIPVIYAQVREHRIPERFPQIDAWVAPIHKVADREGRFRSEDLKDYLGLPPGRKLLLSTCAPDDYQEMLWEKGPSMNYEEHGIDYWFPGHFSIYDNDSKLYQFVGARRQQLHAAQTESQFVWFRLGEHIPIEFLAPVREATSVLISTGQMYSNRSRAILREEILAADRWFPDHAAFFLLGSRHWLETSSSRKCYEINSTWLMRGLRGYNLERVKDMSMSREEVLVGNLRELFENAHDAD